MLTSTTSIKYSRKFFRKFREICLKVDLDRIRLTICMSHSNPQAASPHPFDTVVRQVTYIACFLSHLPTEQWVHSSLVEGCFTDRAVWVFKEEKWGQAQASQCLSLPYLCGRILRPHAEEAFGGESSDITSSRFSLNSTCLGHSCWSEFLVAAPLHRAIPDMFLRLTLLKRCEHTCLFLLSVYFVPGTGSDTCSLLGFASTTTS